MKTLLLIAALILPTAALAHPNTGRVMTLTFGPGQPFATSTKHPFVTACQGPVRMTTAERTILADGTRVWTFTCK